MVAEVSDYRKEAAKDCGADLVVNPKKEKLEEIVMRETNGEGENVVVEAVGPLLPQAVELVSTRGYCA